MLKVEATNTNFIVFGLTRPALEPTIYRTRGDHANHYTTDTVQSQLERASADLPLVTQHQTPLLFNTKYCAA